MPKELFWLTLTVALTGLMWLPYILDRIMVRGLMKAMDNPTPRDKPQSAWATRLFSRTPTRSKISSSSRRWC